MDIDILFRQFQKKELNNLLINNEYRNSHSEIKKVINLINEIDISSKLELSIMNSFELKIKDLEKEFFIESKNI